MSTEGLARKAEARWSVGVERELALEEHLAGTNCVGNERDTSRQASHNLKPSTSVQEFDENLFDEVRTVKELAAVHPVNG